MFLEACRAGDLDAAKSITERVQRDLLRTSYLLTGDRERAIALAIDAIIRLLGNPPTDAESIGHRLALSMAKQVLRTPSRSTWLEQSSDSSYTIGDDRYQVKSTLDLIDPTTRVALVLSTFAGVPEALILGIIDGDSLEHLRSTSQQARSRVALAAGRSSDDPIIDVLNRLFVDLPAVELWQDIEMPVQRAWSRRRRSDRLMTAAVLVVLFAVLGAVTIWLSGIRPSGDDRVSSGAAPTDSPEDIPTLTSFATPTVALASFASAPTIPPPVDTAITVQDMQLLRTIEIGGSEQSTLETYNPDSNLSEPFLPAGEGAQISPDGRWIVATRSLPDSRDISRIVATDLDRSSTWNVDMATPLAMTISNEHLYLFNLSEDDTYQIQLLELATGSLLESWQVTDQSASSPSIRSARLVLGLDNEQLALLTTQIDWGLNQSIRTQTNYDPDTGDLLETFTATESRLDASRAFSVRGARQIPGTSVLYSVVQDEITGLVHLQFLDLNDGSLSSLVLPIEARSQIVAERRGEQEVHIVPSNTGAILYVIQSRQRQIAIVDLHARSIIGAFPITSEGADQALFESNLNHVTYLTALLSPDGETMFLIANRERNRPNGSMPLQSPIWVVDTTTWQINGRWMVDGIPRQLTMSGDGNQLYVRSATSNGNQRLTTFDVQRGEISVIWEDLSGPEWADLRSITSIQQIYQQQHGVRPSVGKILPRDNPTLSVLPGVRVEAEAAVAGSESLLSVRIVHPLTGELATTDSTLRFDPGATILLELSSGNQQAILVLSRSEPAIYHGRVRLDHAAFWDARVTIINRDGTSWSATQPGAIDVADGIRADDGETYRFLVRPGNPVNRRTITLRIWMVESDSGQRLPEEIEFLDQLSDNATIILTHPNGSRIEEPLTRIDHASFIGWVRFVDAGEWTAEIILGLATGERVSIGAGTVQISDLTEPYRRTTGGGGAASTNAGSRMANPASQ